MTEKEQLVARVAELSAKLGRETDPSGTVLELKARIEELEAELEDNAGPLNEGHSNLAQPFNELATKAGSAQRMVCIIPKVTLHLRLGKEPLLAVKDKPCFIDVDQAQQVVEVEQLARYADE
ncbi:DNA-packaging protein FI [Bacillus inaquosorum]|uniref:DNA-packaging protein FI n=1 Tax=Bacillus inaquosorum TaxID=483913 RepID=UPI003CFCAC2B